MDFARDLVLETPFNMYLMDLKEFGTDYESWDPSNPDDLKHPPLASSLDFFKEGLPIGMGSFKLGSALYMIGGEKVKMGLHQLPEVPNPFVLHTFDGDGNQGTSRDVFICKLLSSKELLLEPADTIPKLKAGKARPIVESIEGKIFVHHSMGVFHTGRDNPDPVFEVYIPPESENSWLEIVDVPYVTKSDGLVKLPSYTGYGHFVLGSKLFIPSDVNGLHCFNAATMKWDDESSSNLSNSFNEAGIRRPLFGRCVSGLGLEDNGHHVMVCLRDFGCFRCPRPYGYLINETGRLLCYQDLPEQLFDDFLPYVVPAVESRFLDVGSGKVCAILLGRDKGKTDHVLHICIFKMQKLPSAVDHIPLNPTSPPVEKEFLGVEILKKYFCKLTEYKRSTLINAFVL